MVAPKLGDALRNRWFRGFYLWLMMVSFTPQYPRMKAKRRWVNKGPFSFILGHAPATYFSRPFAALIQNYESSTMLEPHETYYQLAA